jgi:hypothetical protein
MRVLVVIGMSREPTEDLLSYVKRGMATRIWYTSQKSAP